MDILGTIAFAISGVLTACRKRMDIYGVFILSLVTAIGGGITRDVVLGTGLPLSLRNYHYIFVIVLSIIFVFCVHRYLHKITILIVVSDAIGLGMFTVSGIQVALEAGVFLYIAPLFGVLTATGGGMIRDVLIDEIPVVMNREIYAVASLAGGFLYCFLISQFIDNVMVISVVTLVFIIGFRLLSYSKQWHLYVIDNTIDNFV